jgi:hypothetical protein
MKINNFLSAAALALATAFTLSCSDDGGGNTPIKKAQITGVFQKGPFIAGTQATLNELNNDLSPTGRPYQTLITDDKGTFVLKNVELVSPYAHLVANGFYRNEVTGNKSAAPITLQAIVDVTDKDNVNVNILTHLEYYRVLDLVDGGMSVRAAKKKAQKEILAVFGINSDTFKDSEDMTIFGTSESDAALLAISTLLLGYLSEAEFSEMLMNLSMAIKNGGTWNDDAAKDTPARWASMARAADIKKNILGWNLSSNVPDFEKFVRDYWVMRACPENNCFTDPRDGMTYRLATFDNVTIMLNWLAYRGKDGGLGIARDGHICISGIPSCEDITYTWEEAQNICPEGWRLPSKANIESLAGGIFHYQIKCFVSDCAGSAWDNTGHTWNFGGSGMLIDSNNARQQVICVKD